MLFNGRCLNKLGHIIYQSTGICDIGDYKMEIYRPYEHTKMTKC